MPLKLGLCKRIYLSHSVYFSNLAAFSNEYCLSTCASSNGAKSPSAKSDVILAPLLVENSFQHRCFCTSNVNTSISAVLKHMSCSTVYSACSPVCYDKSDMSKVIWASTTSKIGHSDKVFRVLRPKISQKNYHWLVGTIGTFLQLWCDCCDIVSLSWVKIIIIFIIFLLRIASKKCQ